ncbi:MAG TPA: metal-dependent transcriptional regulator [Candidatus Humimicrobiaceae bacterium]
MESAVLSHTLEDYMEAIYLIIRQKKVARVKEIAEFLNVKTPSVVDAIAKLQDMDLIEHEKYGYLSLTDKGISRAELIYQKHTEIYKFLNQFLGMDDVSSERDACGIEHHMCSQTLERITKLMEFIESSPEGYPEWLKRFNSFISKGSG